MTRRERWLAAFAAMTAVHAVVVLAILGVPHPRALITEDVGRVPWSALVDHVRQIWDARDSRSLVTWMPDGSGMLVMAPHNLVDARLHVVSRPGARERFLPRIPRNAAVYSRPGHEHMVLGWDRDGDERFRLYRWDLGHSDPVPITPEAERAIFGAFAADGRRIAYTSSRRNGKDADVYVMDVRDPSTDRRVFQGEGTWGVVAWSPTEDVLLLARATSNVSNELYRLDLGSGTHKRLLTEDEGRARHGSVRFSPDGRWLYYTSDRGGEFLRLRRRDLASDREEVLTDEIGWDVESVQISGDGETILLGVNEDGHTRYYLGPPNGSTWRPLDLFRSGLYAVGMHPEEPTLLVNHTDPRGRVRGYTYDLRAGELTLWTGKPPREAALPEPRLIRYPTFDSVDGGPRLIPAFVYPGVGDGPRPVVIDIHGGPEAQARLGTRASRAQRDGITLITPNVRGSTGYGRTYASLDDWFLRENAVRDIGSLLDWIRAQPDLDAGRVVVTGGSYGGYMVLASLVHYSPRIRCGIDVVGVSNFVTFLENTADYRRDLRRAEYGDERIPEVRAFLESISPLNHAERITSPLMVVQGRNDPRVPVSESRQLVERVRDNGLDVSYVEGRNEGHGFRNPWNVLWTGLARERLVRACIRS